MGQRPAWSEDTDTYYCNYCSFEHILGDPFSSCHGLARPYQPDRTPHALTRAGAVAPVLAYSPYVICAIPVPLVPTMLPYIVPTVPAPASFDSPRALAESPLPPPCPPMLATTPPKSSPYSASTGR